ncbi:MAG TPA: hypothetical protein VGA49_03675, partial [Patescibacteria group bacterium]
MPRSNLYKVIVVAVLAGFLVGIIAELIYQVYFVIPSLTTGDVVINRQLSLESSKKIQSVVQNISPSLVTVYRKKPLREINNPYFADEILGRGLIITNDGWLIAYINSQEAIGSLKNNIIVKTSDASLYNVMAGLEDPATGILFLKIEAANLVPAQFGDSGQLKLSEQIIIAPDTNSARISYLENLNYYHQSNLNQLTLSSEIYSNFLMIQDKPDLRFIGAPVLNLDGEIIGILNKLDENQAALVTPANYFKGLIGNVLAQNKISRPRLGLNYFDLSMVLGLNQQLTHEFKKGALVLNLQKNSPALGLLKTNDIILKVDGEEVTAARGLS